MCGGGIGVVTACLVCNGASDILLLKRTVGGERMGLHVFNTGLVGVVGVGLVVFG